MKRFPVCEEKSHAQISYKNYCKKTINENSEKGKNCILICKECHLKNGGKEDTIDICKLYTD